MVSAVSYRCVNSYDSKRKRPRTYNTQGLSGVWIHAWLGWQAAEGFAGHTLVSPLETNLPAGELRHTLKDVAVQSECGKHP